MPSDKGHPHRAGPLPVSKELEAITVEKAQQQVQKVMQTMNRKGPSRFGTITRMVSRTCGPRLVDTSPPGNESAVSAGTEVGRWTRQLECALSSRWLQNYVDRTAHSTETESRLERQTPCRSGRETRRSGGLPCGKVENRMDADKP